MMENKKSIRKKGQLAESVAELYRRKRAKAWNIRYFICYQYYQWTYAILLHLPWNRFVYKKSESGSYAGNFKMVSVCLTLLYYKNRKLFRIHMDITYSSLSHIGGFKAPPDRPVSESTIRGCGRAQHWSRPSFTFLFPLYRFNFCNLYIKIHTMDS